eukprot:11714858-Alexandrium_andersonii.AAC.1
MCVLAPSGCGLNQVGRTTCCTARACMRNGETSAGAEEDAHVCIKTRRRFSCGSCGCGLNQ